MEWVVPRSGQWICSCNVGGLVDSLSLREAYVL